MYVVYSVHISIDPKRHEADAKIIGITETEDEAYLLAIKEYCDLVWPGGGELGQVISRTRELLSIVKDHSKTPKSRYDAVSDMYTFWHPWDHSDWSNVEDRIEVRRIDTNNATVINSAFQSRVNEVELEVYEDLRNNLQDVLHYSDDLSGADLTGINLSGVNLKGVDLSGADLTGVNLTGLDLIGTIFKDANLSNANLTEANLRGANLWGANLSGTIFSKAMYDSQTVWPDSFDCRSVGAIGPKADLSGRDLSGVNLTEVNLRGINLTRANLTEAILSGANLRWANLSGASLRETNLWNADLSGTNLSETILTGAKYNSETIWPEGFDPDRYGAFKL